METGMTLINFEFATATNILFGSGKSREAISIAATLGRRPLVVTGSTAARIETLFESMQEQKLKYRIFSVSGEPTIPKILDGILTAQKTECDLVIGCGGGSALDTAKAIAVLLTNPGNPLDYLEVVGSGNPLTKPGVPCICIPTTAGTGCEVTRNSVLLSPEHRVKVSLRSPRMLPLLAAIDPDLTLSLSPSLTASTGLDALTQLIEPLVSTRANPLCDSLCREGIQRAARWLPTACEDGGNLEARENMALASLFGGLALANAGLGAVHGLAAPLGGIAPIPHGVVCARLLPNVLAVNLKALRTRAKDSPALSRYEEVGRLLTGKASARAEDGIAWVSRICSDLSVPPLSTFGLTTEDLQSVAEKGLKSSSMKGNPVPLQKEELLEILHTSVGH